MKLVRTGITAILSAAMLLSFASCGGPEDQSSSSNGASNDGTSSDLVLENKQIKFMAHWNMNPASEEEEPRPELQMFQEKYGGEVIDVPVTWDERLDAVMTAAMSDDCPDLTVYWAELMPKGFSNGLYREVDDLIDINGAGWSDLKGVLDLYTYNGKHYVPTPIVTEGAILVYNEQTIKDYNLEDPRELYAKNEWTWDKMLEMMKAFTDPSDTQGGQFGRYGLDGWNPGYNLHLTCGVPFVSLNDEGKLVNNLADPAIERAMNFVGEMNKAGIAFPRLENDGGSIDLGRVATGMTLFADTGLWDYPTYVYRSYQMGEDASFVPWPRDPSSDTYYRSAGIDPHMVFGAAKNLDGVRAWQDCRILVNQDPEIKKENEALWMDSETGYGMTQEDVDFYREMTDLSTFTPVLDWSTGLGVDGVSGYEVANKVWLDGTPWATVREEFTAQFDNAIAAINEG